MRDTSSGLKVFTMFVVILPTFFSHFWPIIFSSADMDGSDEDGACDAVAEQRGRAALALHEVLRHLALVDDLVGAQQQLGRAEAGGDHDVNRNACAAGGEPLHVTPLSQPPLRPVTRYG